MSEEVAAGPSQPMTKSRAPLAAWLALFILSLTTLYAIVDRSVLILLAQPLKSDLHLSDTQIGSLQGLGAVLFTGIAVVPLGWLADRMDRRLLLAACILVWSTAIAACGFATGFWTLLLCAAFLGAGEAGLSPIVFSMIPDLFPERQRMTANFIFYAAITFGGGVGIAIAGAAVAYVPPLGGLLPPGLFSREAWRLVFFAVAIPGPFFAIAILCIRLKAGVTRARPEAGTLPSQVQVKLLDHLTANWRGILAVFVPYAMVYLSMSAIFTWMPVILMRQSGLSAGEVGAGLGVAITAGTVSGLTIAALAAKFLKPRWGALTPPRLAQIGYLIFGLLSPLYFLAHSPTHFLVIATLQMAVTIGGNSLMPTLVQDLAPPYLRGRLFALSAVILTLFQASSPIAVGLLSDHVFNQDGGLLKSSIAIAFPMVIAAALILRLAEKHVMATVERVRALSATT